jgi:TonB-dependent SusC/RagA subfamily outer membrane receptor
MRRKNAFVVCCLSFACALAAQQQPPVTVRGVVTSLADGQPLVGASILQEGTANETTTDRLGEFLLTLPHGSNIVVSSAGHLRQTVALKAGQTLYRIRLRTEEMTPEERLWEPVTVTLDEILQTKVAGVQVFRNSWAPGNFGTVRLTASREEPLYVVDGIPWNRDDLEALAPTDIVGLEVLKDAADLALYGQEGSQGVILISTRGAKSGVTTVTYLGGLSFQETPRTLPHLNLQQYADYIGTHWQQTPAQFLDPSLLGEGTDWQQEVFRPAFMQNHQVSLQGGTERLRLSASSGWLGQQGTVIASRFSRFHARARVDADVSKWLSAGASLAFARTEKMSVPDNLFATLLTTPPDIPVYNFDGSWGGYHPLRTALTQGAYHDKEYFAGSLYAGLTPCKGLSLRSEYAFQENRNYFNSVPDYGHASWRWKNRLTYSLSRHLHHFAFLAGFEAISLYAARNQALYASLRYQYDQRYYLGFSLRHDDDPLFTRKQDPRIGVSLAWSIADEPFLRGNPFLSTLKLRAGISVPFSHTVLSTSTTLSTSRTLSTSHAGIDLAFFEDRLALIFDTYRRVYDSELDDRGYDLSLRTVNIDLPHSRWTSALHTSVFSGALFAFHNTATFRAFEASLSFTGSNSSRNQILYDGSEESGAMNLVVYRFKSEPFIRIQNAALGYSFPPKLIRPLSLNALKIEASVQNPYVFTSSGGFDPETATSGYPPYRAATLALYLRF